MGSGGELVEVYLLPLPVAVVAPQANRLLHAALPFGGRDEIAERPCSTESRRPGHAAQQRAAGEDRLIRSDSLSQVAHHPLLE